MVLYIPTNVIGFCDGSINSVTVEHCRMEWTGWHSLLATSCMASCVMIWVLAKHFRHCAYWLVIIIDVHRHFRFVFYCSGLKLLYSYSISWIIYISIFDGKVHVHYFEVMINSFWTFLFAELNLTIFVGIIYFLIVGYVILCQLMLCIMDTLWSVLCFVRCCYYEI